ncbi:MAG: hypothetical protein MI702_01320, partial [Chlorobiales bacterium]|nr:hypothetical protein [Chlorobiales bacterium]
QSLAFFLLVAPEHAPEGTKEKLQAWAQHMKVKTDNFWHYRKHSDTEWGHPRSKELGNTGLGGSMFAVAHLLDDPELRALGWSQVNQVFGMNPAEAHYSHKDPRRLKRNGYWDGVEVGWPIRDPGGAGRLGAVRGTLDGTPTDSAFPYPKEPMDTDNVAHSPNHWYTTEGWGLSNRCWQSTVTFATLGSHRLTVWDPERKHQLTKVRQGDQVLVQLRAALNMETTKVETGTLQVYQDDTFLKTINVKETGPNTGLFQSLDTIDCKKDSRLTYAYGYLGFEQKALLEVH